MKTTRIVAQKKKEDGGVPTSFYLKVDNDLSL